MRSPFDRAQYVRPTCLEVTLPAAKSGPHNSLARHRPDRACPAASLQTHSPLLNALLYEIIRTGRINRDHVNAHTIGFEELRSQVRECTPAWAAGICDVPAAEIERAAEVLGGAARSRSRPCTRRPTSATESLSHWSTERPGMVAPFGGTGLGDGAAGVSLLRFDGHRWCGGQAARPVSYSAGLR
ncbi:hypothetical protein GCM10010505_46670 [Kitasatospora aburaviensis]